MRAHNEENAFYKDKHEVINKRTAEIIQKCKNML